MYPSYAYHPLTFSNEIPINSRKERVGFDLIQIHALASICQKSISQKRISGILITLHDPSPNPDCLTYGSDPWHDQRWVERDQSPASLGRPRFSETFRFHYCRNKTAGLLGAFHRGRCPKTNNRPRCHSYHLALTTGLQGRYNHMYLQERLANPKKSLVQARF